MSITTFFGAIPSSEAYKLSLSIKAAQFEELPPEIQEKKLKKTNNEIKKYEELSTKMKQVAFNTIAMLGTAIVAEALLFQASPLLIGVSIPIAIVVGVVAWKHFNSRAHAFSKWASLITELDNRYKRIFDTTISLDITDPTKKEHKVPENKTIKISYPNGDRITYSRDGWNTTKEFANKSNEPLRISFEPLQPGEIIEFNIKPKGSDWLRPFRDDFQISAS